MESLSKRENQVLKLNALGYAVDEIAHMLFISRDTVRKTISNIKAKLNLQKATELAAYYWCKAMDTTLEEQRKTIISGILLIVVSFSLPYDFEDKLRVRRARMRRKYKTELIVPTA